MTEHVNEIRETLIDETWVSETDADNSSYAQFHFTLGGKYTYHFFADDQSPVLTQGIFEIISHEGRNFLKTISEDHVEEVAEITDLADHKFTLTGELNQLVRYVLLVE